VEERVRHSGVDEGDGAKKGNGGGRHLLWRPDGVGGEEKGQGGPRFGAAWRKNGEERGGLARWGTARAASRPTVARSRCAWVSHSVRAGEGGAESLARGARPDVWGDLGKEMEWAQPE
jgi:hypothetical protein